MKPVGRRGGRRLTPYATIGLASTAKASSGATAVSAISRLSLSDYFTSASCPSACRPIGFRTSSYCASAVGRRRPTGAGSATTTSGPKRAGRGRSEAEV